MNLKLWIFILMVALFMILTEQADDPGESSTSSAKKKDPFEWTAEIFPSFGDRGESSTSSSEEKSCSGWMVKLFSISMYGHNKNVAEKINRAAQSGYDIWDTINIWQRGYAKALLDISRHDILLPYPFCLFFKKFANIKMPNITALDYKTCADWVMLSGYNPTNGDGNLTHAQSLIHDKVSELLSDCAHIYATHLIQRDKEGAVNHLNPVEFCNSFLQSRASAQVSFKDCTAILNET